MQELSLLDAMYEVVKFDCHVEQIDCWILAPIMRSQLSDMMQEVEASIMEITVNWRGHCELIRCRGDELLHEARARQTHTNVLHVQGLWLRHEACPSMQ